MSHIVTVTTRVRDPIALGLACQRLKLPPPVHGTTKLFSAEATGHKVSLPQWRYPVVCNCASGEVHYDNFGGRWGNQEQLDRLMQAYTIEKAKLEARRQGHRVTENRLDDGSVKLTLSLGESA